MDDIPRILEALERGEPHAAADLLPLVYDELRRLAARELARERPGQTLDATALVHEAYLRLAGDQRDPQWSNRRYFFAAAAQAMRRILVENARRKGRVKHGGAGRREVADLDAFDVSQPPAVILDLHEALERFAARQPQKAKLVELRYFGGLTLEEAANTLEISLATAERAWSYARAWLHAALASPDAEKKKPES